MAAPLNNAVLTQFEGAGGTAGDNVAVQRVDLYLLRRANSQYWNGRSWTPIRSSVPATLASAGTNRWNWLWINGMPSAAQLPEGAYLLSAIAFDRVGNRSSLAANFVVDRVAPRLTITAPTERAVISSLPRIAGRIEDTVRVPSRVELMLQRRSDGRFWNGSAWRVESAVFNALVSGNAWSLSTGMPSAAQLGNGTYSVIASATDAANNRARAVVTFTVRRATTTTATRSVVLSPRADAATSIVTLLLSSGEVDELSLLVNGKVVEAEASGRHAGGRCWFQLPAGTLHTGNTVEVVNLQTGEKLVMVSVQ
jgi:hypothetical protein